MFPEYETVPDRGRPQFGTDRSLPSANWQHCKSAAGMLVERRKFQAYTARMEIERNLGVQPIAELIQQLHITPHILVESSTEQLTHKLVSRAVKGRRLTKNSQGKVVRAMNAATGQTYTVAQLFNY